MNNPRNAFLRRRADEWTLERIARMTAQEIQQLRENAERLEEAELAARCTEALGIVRARTLAERRAAREAAAGRAAPAPARAE